MRNLKKALSLTLALALSLALAVPAFADDSGWSLSVQGKTVDEFVVPSAAFERRSWELSGDSYQKAENTWTAEWDSVVSLKAGDTMVLTISKPGTISIKAWSDPDGDGIYEQRMYEASGTGGNLTYTVLPLTATSIPWSPYDEDMEEYQYGDTCRLTTDGQLGWTSGQRDAYEEDDSDSPHEWEDVNVSAAYLLQQFGPNTYLDITCYLRPGLMNYAAWYVYLDGESGGSGSGGATPVEPEQPAAPEQPSVSGDSSSISVTVGGESVMWTDAAPFIDANDRTMVPLRAVADAMGLDVDWAASARVASFSDGDKIISFPIDSNTAQTSDGDTVQMDTAAVIANERTYAPIRYLAEYFGYTVGWDAATQTVSLTK